MQKRGFLLKYVGLVLTFIVMRAHCVPALPGSQFHEVPANATFLHFGQSQAVADFDGDHRLDLATLTWVGRDKSLEIYLSHTKARTLVHFSTQSIDCGSLFTKDIDNDGDNDLVWTDLLHPDDVVVWVDDGTGRFDRVSTEEHAPEFVLTDGPVCGDSKDTHQDFAYGARRDPSTALPQAHRTSDFDRVAEFREKQPRTSIVPFAFRIPFDRGPPSLI